MTAHSKSSLLGSLRVFDSHSRVEYKLGYRGMYFRLDLQAEYEFWDDRASLSVGVRNLLDNHHPEGASLFLNDAEVPRMIYAEFRFSL
ncbi:MAG: TonB-dependent receptor [Phycisphaerae bacterium]|nr:TonB-dependent receptor [Phycisphaerae bacterium]